ncbi:hypothetical protein T484DRAFT_1778724, partial [Baffinella frigidus]
VLSERGRTLEALGLSGTVHLSIVAPEEDVRVVRGGGCTTMVVMESPERDEVHQRFEALLGVLSEHEGGDEALLTQVWDILTLLPTHPRRKHALSSLLARQQPEAWTNVCGGAVGVWASVYQLQILDALLIPRSLPCEEVEERRRNFLVGGGASAVMEVLAMFCKRGGAWCHPTRLSWKIGVEVCLRILNLIIHCLLQLPMGPGGVGSPGVDGGSKVSPMTLDESNPPSESGDPGGGEEVVPLHP